MPDNDSAYCVFPEKFERNGKDCFGKFSESGDSCGSCEYADSCRFVTEDDRRVRIQDSRWESAVEFNDEIRHDSSLPSLPVSLDKKTYTRDEVVALSAYLLRIGSNRKLGKILNAKLTGSARSFSDIARSEGVSRQAIHKRIGKELASVFGFKNRRLTDSRLLTLDTNEFAILKLSRNGFDENEIAEELNMEKQTMKYIRESLEWKLSRPT